MDILINILYYYGVFLILSLLFTLLFPIFDVISVKSGLSKFNRLEYSVKHPKLSVVVLPILSFMAWIQYIAIVLNKLISGKTVIVSLPMMLITYKGKRWARNRVYNYFLDNGLTLKRLNARDPILVGRRYMLTKGRQTEYGVTGYIEYNRVSSLEYILASFIWLWHDDDNSFDMTSSSYAYEVYKGIYWNWVPMFIRKHCRTRENIIEEGGVDPDRYICRKKGKYFDIGDIYENEFTLVAGIFWNIRNGMYNANYYYEEVLPDSWNDIYKVFKFRLFGKDIVWHFGYMRYTYNPEHIGRAVWFNEDLTRAIIN